MLFSEFYKIMVNKVTFVDFSRGDRPNLPRDPILNIMFVSESYKRKIRNCVNKLLLRSKGP